MRRAPSQMASTRRQRAQLINSYQAARSVVSRCCYSPIYRDRVDGRYYCELCDHEVDPNTGRQP